MWNEAEADGMGITLLTRCVTANVKASETFKCVLTRAKDSSPASTAKPQELHHCKV